VTIFVNIIRILCDVLTIVILLRVIVSWYLPRPTNILVRTLYRLTDPILAPIRRVIPRLGPFDFSPLVAIILIRLIYYLFYYLLP
jgi:YggT family protein